MLEIDFKLKKCNVYINLRSGNCVNIPEDTISLSLINYGKYAENRENHEISFVSFLA